LGSYSEVGSAKVVVSLKKARDARDRARLEHRTGVDPVQRRHLAKLTRGAIAGTTFAALPDLIAMLRRRSSRGMNPRMASIMGIFQIGWIYYGLLIASRPVPTRASTWESPVT